MSKEFDPELGEFIDPADMLDIFLSYENFSLTDSEIDEIEARLDKLILDPESDDKDLRYMADRLQESIGAKKPDSQELEDANLAFLDGIDPRQVVDMVHAYRHIVDEG